MFNSGNCTFNFVAFFNLFFGFKPRIRLKLFQAKGNTLLVMVNGTNFHINYVTDYKNIRR